MLQDMGVLLAGASRLVCHGMMGMLWEGAALTAAIRMRIPGQGLALAARGDGTMGVQARAQRWQQPA